MLVRHSSLASLTLAVKLAEPTGNGLGEYVAEQREVFAPLLGVSAETLRAAERLSDSELAPQLETLLRRRMEERAQRHQLAVQERTGTAASHLVRSARWEGDQAHVDVRLLLGDLLADARPRFISFVAQGLFDVSIYRSKLSEVARAMRNYDDLIAFIDSEGLHFRWREGRGGLNLVSQQIPRTDEDRVLRVFFRRDVTVFVRDQLVLLRRPGAWLGDVLSDLGLVP